MSTTPDTPLLSVVIVSRNEEERIGACIESVFDLCDGGPPFEVLLVDSNSTDRSVERAAEYPITVLEIPSDDLSTPSAGRYVGTHRAHGEYVLFVDGDMELVDSWLDTALDLLRTRPDVAGVTGFLNEVDVDSVHEVDALRGVAMYEKRVLDAVGGFDPHLLSSEDTDLGYRLAAAGYSLLRLPTVVAMHPTAESIDEPLRRWRYGYFHGVGQALRKSACSPRVCARHLYSLRFPLLSWAWIGLGVALAVRHRDAFGGWVAASVIGFFAETARDGPIRPLIYAASFVLTFVGLALGWRRSVPDPSAYPRDRIRTVKEHRAVHRSDR